MNELGLENYNVDVRYTLTSSHLRYGGVLIATRKDVSSEVIRMLLKIMSSTFVKLSLKNCNCIVSSVYLPPNCATDMHNVFISEIESIVQSYPNHIFLFCDFNLAELIWSNDLA